MCPFSRSGGDTKPALSEARSADLVLSESTGTGSADRTQGAVVSPSDQHLQRARSILGELVGLPSPATVRGAVLDR